MTNYYKLIICLIPFIISGLFNQYLYFFNENVGTFGFNVFTAAAAIAVSAFLSAWSMKLCFGCDIRKSTQLLFLIFYTCEYFKGKTT
ncbi:hypothetical protein EUY23_24615 [Salmonella enterica]|nr:hypothetical protein [Salmonella enterica]